MLLVPLELMRRSVNCKFWLCGIVVETPPHFGAPYGRWEPPERIFSRKVGEKRAPPILFGFRASVSRFSSWQNPKYMKGLRFRIISKPCGSVTTVRNGM